MKRIVHSAWLGRGWCRGWATLTVMLLAVVQSPAVTVTNTVTRPLPAYQKVVTPSSTCNNMVYWEARHAPSDRRGYRQGVGPGPHLAFEQGATEYTGG